jgi:hypothetical protein
MISYRQAFLSMAALPLFAAVSVAASIDGSISGDLYGDPLAVQANGTSFGNSNLGSPDFANGSELDAAYMYRSGGFLNVLLTGNLETNFNKLEVFFDVRPGGQNQLRGDNPDVDFNGLNRMGNDGSGNGLMFDEGFEADYYITYTTGNSPVEHYMSAAELLTGGGGAGGFVGGGPKASVNPISGTGPRTAGLLLASSNQSNALGVGSFGNPPDSPPESVQTGIELSASLAELNWDGVSPIKVTAFINGSNHDFLSNQILGTAPLGTDHLAEPRNVNLKNVDGNQFFAIPEPSSLALIALGGMLVGLVRRRG